MARFSRAARAGDHFRGRCDIRLHTKTHHCGHFLTGHLSGSCNVYINGIPAQKVGDSATFETCQHSGSGVVVDGSGTVFINKKAAARIKDGVRCQNPMCARTMYIIEGSSNVFIGD